MKCADCTILVSDSIISSISELLTGVAEKWGEAEVQAGITLESKVRGPDFSWKTGEESRDIKSAWALAYRYVIYINEKNEHIEKEYNFWLSIRKNSQNNLY